MSKSITAPFIQSAEQPALDRAAYLRGELSRASAQAVENYLHYDAGHRPATPSAERPGWWAAWRAASVLLGLCLGVGAANWLLAYPLNQVPAAITRLVPGPSPQLLAEVPLSAVTLGADSVHQAAWPAQP